MLGDTINEYLYYGYAKKNPITLWDGTLNSEDNFELDYTPDGASKKLDHIFDDVFSKIKLDGYCIIPLSGGWDSRVMLGSALNRLPTCQIKTVSFGCPKQLDYELGYKLANSVGVEHHRVDLSKIQVNWLSLISSTRNSPWTYALDAFFNSFSISSVSNEKDTILSGFMGDPLTGGHTSPSTTKHEAIAEFQAKQKFSKRENISPSLYNPSEGLEHLVPPKEIKYIDYLDYGIRQANCIAPILGFKKFWAGWGDYYSQHCMTKANFLTPFTHKAWANYWLKASDNCKKDQKLYKEMINTNFPKLVEIGSKDTFGIPHQKKMNIKIQQTISRGKKKAHRYFPCKLTRENSMLNYVDFSTFFRIRNDYQEILYQAVDILDKNCIAPWVNFEKIIDLHMKRKEDNYQSILLIIGLALNIECLSKNNH
ncbi:hypothetical protein [Thalassospira australica]|uniref:hypothetical protein n=1 Tax=Thalassospira australica TaxID=1528106 RepID=UPI00384F943F